MKNRKQLFEIIAEEYRALREAEESDAAARRENALRLPGFARAEAALRAAEIAAARAKAAGRDCRSEEKAAAEASAVYDALIKKYGLDLGVGRRCPLCGDTGFASGGELCSCARQRYTELVKEECGASSIPGFSFGDDMSRELPCAQSEALSKLYSAMREFCRRFETSRIKFILLSGQSGTGKSSVAYAAANELLSRGVTVFYVTAFDFNNLMLRYHTSPVETRAKYMDPVLGCDFLIIDDLGSESILKSVTREYLYNVVDSRVNSGKRTMATTNLKIEELMARYGERTVSRMINKKYSLTRELVGDDLRLIPRK